MAKTKLSPAPLWMAEVVCRQIVPDDQLGDDDDRQDTPAGRYMFRSTKPTRAEAYEDLLDQFHSTVPIGCLDDFEVAVRFNDQTEPYAPPPESQAP